MSSKSLRYTAISFTIVSLIAFLAQGQGLLNVGYAILTPEAGAPVPASTALLRTMNAEGVLISETSIPAVRPARSGLVYVDEVEARTGFAFVNPADLPANVSLFLRDAGGTEIARRVVMVGPRRHMAQFVADLFGAAAAGFRGSLGFQSDQSVGAAGLRQSFNSRGESIYTAIPLVDSASSESTTAIIPHVRSGDGYLSEIVLLNRSGQRARGRVRSIGSPLIVEDPYDIPANGVQRISVGGSGPEAGYVEVVAEPGNTTPGALAIVQLRSAEGLVSEALVPQVAAKRAGRLLIESAGTQTRLSVANPNTESAGITFTLLDRFGTTISSVTRTLPASASLFLSADELFSSVSLGFLGQIEIESDAAVSAVAIRSSVNSRNELILSSLPVADLTPQAGDALILPQLSAGNGFSTRLIFINRDTRVAAAGQIRFFRSDGSPMELSMPDGNGSGASYQLNARGSRQLFPGNAATVSVLSLRDPVSNAPTSELTINEGATARPGLLVIDSSGIARDDFTSVPAVTNSEVASVAPGGVIVGRRAGFSSLAIAVAGNILTATVTVVSVESGVPGFDIAGVAVDSARKFYMASPEEHTILLSRDLRQAPALWAGSSRSSGLKDDLRLESQFRNPSYLTLRADGTVYVSDSANHVIRQIRPGPNGRVTTIAGTGVAGASDGGERGAAFSNPQGVALDDRGYLWVADSGNHTIRRINLVTGQVTSVAGQPGVSGLADGQGAAALFRSPTGIAFEPEPLVEELARERAGGPRAVQMIVSDTGNGLIRRVTENGEVETILTPLQSAARGEGYATRVTQLRAPTFNNPAGVTLDAAGTIYVAEAGDVRAILQTGAVVRATQAGTLARPKGVAITETGQIVVADSQLGLQQIRFGEPEIASVTPNRISSRGGARVTIRGRNFAPETIVVVAGKVISDATIANTETIAFTAPQLESGRTTLTVQNRGGLAQRDFVVDPIPLQELPPGSITTLVGGSTFAGDGGPAIDAPVALPEQTAIDASGNVYITDTSNHRIRKVDRTTGVITTVAGNGDSGLSGDGGPAVAATFTFPGGIALDGSGNLFISDTGNSRIRKVDAATGLITTIAGRRLGFSGDEGAAIAADLNAPRGLAFDPAGNLYVADSTNHRIRRITRAGIITTVAGNGQADFSGDDGPATAAALNSPRAVAVGFNGDLWIADTFNSRVRRVDAAGIIGTVDAGDLRFPRGVAVDVNGDVVISDTGNHRILRVTVLGNISTVAGVGTPGFSGDEGRPTDASLNEPYGIALDGSGILVIADHGNNRIRKIAEGGNRLLTPFGVSLGPPAISTIAGNGQLDYLGDGSPATAAKLRSPSAVAADAAGNLYIADSGNHRVRVVDRATGNIATLVGTGRPGFAGDNGPAAAALINFPQGLAVDGDGAVYIADTENHRIRKVDPGGTIRTLAGTGVNGYSGDNERATSAQLSFPTGLSTDAQGNLYIADTGNHRIRRVAAGTGVITTIAGGGSETLSDAGRLATEVALSSPRSAAVDSSGNLYIADSGNDQIRSVDSRTQIIRRIAGTGERKFSGDGGPAIAAALNFPLSVAIDRSGAVLILDSFNHRLRQLSMESGVIQTIAGTGAPGFGGDGGPAANALLRAPAHVAIDPAGNVLIADTANHRIRGMVVSSPSR